MTNYLFESTLIIILSYLVYKFILKGEKSFQFNRFYLISCLLLSLFIPLIEFNNPTISNLIEPLSVKEASNDIQNQYVMEGESTHSIKAEDSFESYFFYFYLLGLSIMKLRFLKNIFHLFLLIKRNEKANHDMKVVLLNTPTPTFSFFNYLFIDQSTDLNTTISKNEIEHEKIHSKEWHSLDILLVELCLIGFWFNPFLWLYRKEISENHEYIADHAITNNISDIQTYSNQMIHSAQKVPFNILGSGFSFIHLKNRINMLHRKKSKPFKVITKLFSAVLLISAVCFISSFQPSSSSEPFVVIIDAGHGGEDHGVSYDNLNEKDINLRISEILKELNVNSDIQLTFLRENDETISLQDRLEWVNKQNAAFYLSLHTNYAPTHQSKKGMEAYFTNQPIHKNDSSKKYLPIIQFAMGLANNLDTEVKIKQASFYMLKGINCPGVLLEMGFLSNSEDRQLLSAANSQEKLATGIYNAIIEVKNNMNVQKD